MKAGILVEEAEGSIGSFCALCWTRGALNEEAIFLCYFLPSSESFGKRKDMFGVCSNLDRLISFYCSVEEVTLN